MVKKRAFSQMERFRELKRTELKRLNMQVVKRISFSQMVQGSENILMDALRKLSQTVKQKRRQTTLIAGTELNKTDMIKLYVNKNNDR